MTASAWGIRTFTAWGVLSLAFGCVSNQEQFSNNFVVELPTKEAANVQVQVETGLTLGTDQIYSIEWTRCETKPGAPFVLMLNTEAAAFTEKSCREALPQAFLRQSINVLAVNRPGFGKSQGQEALGDDKTVESIRRLMDEQRKTNTLIGVWAYEEGSVTAFRVAKNNELKFIIVGNGLYDWDATVAEAKDPAFVSRLKELQGQDSRFAENRSVAWDLAGLPKSVYLYHESAETRFPVSQAEAFRDSLASNQYVTQLHILKPGEDQVKMTPVIHSSIITQIMQSLLPSIP